MCDLTERMKMLQCFQHAQLEDLGYIGLLIGLKGFDEPFQAVHPVSNMDYLIEFYMNHFDDNLMSITGSGTRVLAFEASDDPKELVERLLDEY